MAVEGISSRQTIFRIGFLDRKDRSVHVELAPSKGSTSQKVELFHHRRLGKWEIYEASVLHEDLKPEDSLKYRFIIQN